MIDETNIDIFDQWAVENKDIGMEKGHQPSVNKMISTISERTDILNRDFNFLDIGCGNGWVVKKFSNNPSCQLSVGVDGSYNMINKAKKKDPNGLYYQSPIEYWESEEKFDIIFSMETFYYFENINIILNKIFNHLLNNDSIIIFGIDHYKENQPSLSWEQEIGIKTKTRCIAEWIDLIDKFGFKEIEALQFGQKDEWAGTLIISAKKY
tara:strand:- start:856 stop:1482 length:627 start_codon:yes stop_codon:yes gene_type:complete